MLITCTVLEPLPADWLVAVPSFSAPHAASTVPAPLTAANAPAVRVMNARRVVRASLTCTIRLLLSCYVLALVLSIVESCQGIRNRLSATTAR